MSDINVLSGGAPKEALAVLTPQFEAKTGHKVHYSYAVISEMQKKLAAGETPDMVFMPVGAIDALVKAGTLRPQPRGVLGSVGIGVIVREGGPHPDISTPEKFREALLNARAVVHANPTATPSGAHLGKLTRELGIERELKDKVTYSNALDGGVERITKGEAEIGIYPVSEVIAVKGVALVGLLPPALQSLIVYGAAVLAANPAPSRRRTSSRSSPMPVMARCGRRRASRRASVGSNHQRRSQERNRLRCREMDRHLVRDAAALHEAVVAIRIVLDDRRRRAALQVGLQAVEHVPAGEMVLAGADHMHRAGDARRQSDGILILPRQWRRLDGRVIRHAGRDTLVMCREQQGVTPAKAKARRADRCQRQLLGHERAPPRHLTQ